MRIIPIALLAGAGSIVLAGSVMAQSLPVHTMTLQLPDGSIEKINYTGDVAPRVAFAPPSVDPWAFVAFDGQSPFAALEQMSALMDRETASLFQQVQDFTANPNAGANGLFSVDTRGLPPGAEAYSFVATMSPDSVCSRSMEVIDGGPGLKPRVIMHSSGNCGASGNAATVDVSPAPAMGHPNARLDQADAATARPGRALLREASYQKF